MKLVECVPNFSEGRRPEVVKAIRDAIAAVEGVTVLDASSDASHNRSVITFVVPLERAVEAAFAGIQVAGAKIDMRQHSGEHPRIGAADVVPFVPLEDTTMDDCITLARDLGRRVGDELGIPVYLYERAATRPTRVNLADVRRGQFEALSTEIGSNPDRDPDFGPRVIHASAGAVAIGARPFLVAYNVYLGDAGNLPLAKTIAKGVRESSGGFKHVKGLGLEVDGQAQVSMNLVDTEATPLHVPFDFISEQAKAAGAEVTWSEIIGLVPERVLFDSAKHYLKLAQFTNDQVLERQVAGAMRASGAGAVAEQSPTPEAKPAAAGVDQSPAPDAKRAAASDAFLSAVASAEPVPGGGSVAAYAGALAAALTRMVTGLTLGKKKYAAVESEIADIASSAAALMEKLEGLVASDAVVYSAVSAAYKMPKGTEAEVDARKQAITTALLAASEIPLETARACAGVADLAAAVAEKGNSKAITDSGVAALLADAGCKGAAYNVRINVSSLDDPSSGELLVREAMELVQRTETRTRATMNLVEKALQ
ncbi:MAG TPA: glutamate formimidoyltransferase [Gemmatimonadaceae bacterium]|nr:glutamate formimidoyltransferase [Gemmatimonadaceae bacterium]